jgi:general stress protein 26
MKIDAQHTPEMVPIAERLASNAVAMLTTLDAQGLMTSRPMTALKMDHDGAVWFFVDSRSPKLRFLDSINLTFVDHDETLYVSLTGHGEVVPDRLAIEALWTMFARPWFPQGPSAPYLALLKFVPSCAEYWDAPHGAMVRTLALAASVVAGKPVGQGQHAAVTLRSVGSRPLTSQEHLPDVIHSN